MNITNPQIKYLFITKKVKEERIQTVHKLMVEESSLVFLIPYVMES